MSRRYYRQGERIDLDRDFPEIEDVTGVVEINPSFGGPRKEVKSFDKSHLPVNYVYCESTVCNNGGVALGEMLWKLLSKMVGDGQTEDKASEFCRGYEKMGRGQTRQCHALFVSLKVQIKYKEPEIEKVE